MALQYAGVNETIRQRKIEPAGFKGYERAYVDFDIIEPSLVADDPTLSQLGPEDQLKKVAYELQDIKRVAKSRGRQTEQIELAPFIICFNQVVFRAQQTIYCVGLKP